MVAVARLRGKGASMRGGVMAVVMVVVVAVAVVMVVVVAVAVVVVVVGVELVTAWRIAFADEVPQRLRATHYPCTRRRTCMSPLHDNRATGEDNKHAPARPTLVPILVSA